MSTSYYLYWQLCHAMACLDGVAIRDIMQAIKCMSLLVGISPVFGHMQLLYIQVGIASYSPISYSSCFYAHCEVQTTSQLLAFCKIFGSYLNLTICWNYLCGEVSNTSLLMYGVFDLALLISYLEKFGHFLYSNCLVHVLICSGVCTYESVSN